MHYNSLTDFLHAADPHGLRKGPLALVMAEDEVELDTTLRHLINAGFPLVALLAPQALVLPPTLAGEIIRIDYDVYAEDALPNAVNQVIAQAPGIWLFYCYNGEYLFYPFCETRNIRELLAFQGEERREAFLSYVIDLYAGDLSDAPNAVSLKDAHLDKSGYYALARPNSTNHNHPHDRQLDFFGGLRWRFEEHVPPHRRKIDRICLFKTRPGLRLRSDYTLSDEEMNTYACPWHNNVTTAILSFRTAKALRSNPGSRYSFDTFLWRNSTPFHWHSQQLMDLGLIEPGQWF